MSLEQIKKELAEWDDLIAKRPELKGMCGKWPEWVRSLIDEAEKHKRQAEERGKALEWILEYWNRDENEKAMSNALWKIIDIAEDALGKEQPNE